VSDARTIQVYDERVEQYAEVIVDAGEEPPFHAFCAGLTPGAKVLDLGCGPGLHAANLAEAGFRVTAWDAAAAMAARAAMAPGVDARQARFEDLTATAAYDGIWANFSLLHAPRAAFPGHLAACHRALTPRGLFQIGLKTGTGEATDRLGRFYSYYQPKELEAHLAEAGFTPLTRWTGCDTGFDGAPAEWIAILCRR